MKRLLLPLLLLVLAGCNNTLPTNDNKYKIGLCENKSISIYENNGDYVNGFSGNEWNERNHPELCETDYAVFTIGSSRIVLEKYSSSKYYQYIYDTNGFYYTISYWETETQQ
jgi:hypothetical protein